MAFWMLYVGLLSQLGRRYRHNNKPKKTEAAEEEATAGGVY